MKCDWCNGTGAWRDPPEPKGRVPLTICDSCYNAETDRL